MLGGMRLLDRYLLRELLVPLSYCLSGFLLLMVTADLIHELGSFQERKLHAADIGAYYVAKLPEFLVLGLPLGLLLALLYALTNHARHNELTAIRAAGVSLWRIGFPYFAAGFLASLAVLVLNELWLPSSAERIDQIQYRYVPRPPGMDDANLSSSSGIDNARDGRLWHFSSYDVRTSEMLNPVVDITLPNGAHRLLKADRAARINNIWTFYNAFEWKKDPQSNSPPVPLLHTNRLAKPEFLETPDQIKTEIKISPMLSSLGLRGARKADIPLIDLWNYLRFHPQPTQPALLYTKLHGRLATPWTCLVVVLIAIPFGAASGRRNIFVGVAGSIAIFLAFFTVQQISLGLGSSGYIAAWLAGWFPNLSFALVGSALICRVR
jgi:lipopolysaccharide export system permease protein